MKKVSELREGKKMGLFEHQWEFLKDVAKLIEYMSKIKDLEVSGGHLWRTKREQEFLLKIGRSRTMNSKHLDRLAIDFNFKYKGQIVGKHKVVEDIAKYWESLSEYNEAGYFWSFFDPSHFQRNTEKRTKK